MALILGIDAAWTEHGSSALALLRAGEGERSIIAVAPSYDEFIGLARGEPVAWRVAAGSVPQVPDLIAAARALGGGPVDVVAVDMPMSRQPIDRRRNADQAVSRAFGRYRAAVHSPSAHRPDQPVTGMVRALEAAGFELATMAPPRLPALVEVYPLAALVQLLGCAKRPLYKVSKIARYCKGTMSERIDRLLETWSSICAALEQKVGDIGISFPERDSIRSLAHLKPYEDAIDAVVCAWVGACVVDGTAKPYPPDDPDAAIWIPDRVTALPWSAR
jgi:predicted RNase H-like nuclease